MLRFTTRVPDRLLDRSPDRSPSRPFLQAFANLHSPVIVAIGILAYVTLCMLILLFAGPNYAAELNAEPNRGPVNSMTASTATGARNTSTNTFKTEYADWTDSARKRTLPVKLLIPTCATPCPVILFSHGLGGSREGGKAWGEYWASHGYFVVHLQHPGSDESVWKDQGKPSDRLSALRNAANAQQLIARGRDVRFVLDELERRHAQYPMADLSRIGMSGHSFGAVTTQGVAGQSYGKLMGSALLEPRIRSALAFSPSARGQGTPAKLDETFGSITIPFMSITGTRDTEQLVSKDVTPENRVLPFEHMRGDDKYLLVLNDADHMLFNGTPGLREYPGQADRTATLAIEPRAFELVEAVSLAYWDTTLKNDASARRWLNGRDGFVAMLGDAGRFSAR